MFQLHQLNRQQTKRQSLNGGIVPLDPPTVEIPEFQGGIPGIPEVHEKPEFNGGIPGIPEVHEKPEFDGGVVPNDAPYLGLARVGNSRGTN